jgi:hypothetical protein
VRPFVSRRIFPLIVERLEDRLVPGESLTALLFTPLGLAAAPELVAEEIGLSDDPVAVAVSDIPQAAGNDRLFSHQDDAVAPGLFAGSAGDVSTSLGPAASAGASINQDVATPSSVLGFSASRSDDFGLWLPQPVSARFSGAASRGSLMNSGDIPSAGISAPLQGGVTGVAGLARPETPGLVGAVAANEGGAGAGFAEPDLLVRPASNGGPHGGPPHHSSFNGYTPAQIKSAYGVSQLNANVTGVGITIAIIDAFDAPNIASDLTTFDSKFGVPAANFVEVQPQGKPAFNSGWAQEISLDVEWAHSMAPGAKIVLEEAATNSDANLYAAVDDAVTKQGAQVVSMSWGSNEYAGETSDDAHFNKSGVTFLASSGDKGGTVGYPSASPYVLSAGGTSLPFDSNGNPVPTKESAWSSGGGGPSTIEAEPGYQVGFYSGTTRGTPDLSSDSDPNTGVLVVYNGGLYIFGGTSVAAPTLAGEIALADQGRVTPLSSNSVTSRAEYNAAAGSLYSSNYRDITTGSDGYAAAVGYDLAAGLGAPLVNNLVPWLNTNL